MGSPIGYRLEPSQKTAAEAAGWLGNVDAVDHALEECRIKNAVPVNWPFDQVVIHPSLL